MNDNKVTQRLLILGNNLIESDPDVCRRGKGVQ